MLEDWTLLDGCMCASALVSNSILTQHIIGWEVRDNSILHSDAYTHSKSLREIDLQEGFCVKDVLRGCVATLGHERISTIHLPPGPVWPTLVLAFHRHIKAANCWCAQSVLLRVCSHFQPLQRQPLRKEIKTASQKLCNCELGNLFLNSVTSAHSTSA